MLKPVYNITPFTMLDYPSHTACIIWFTGCNMRCVYCYNPEIVLGKGTVSVEDAIAFLQSRKHLLQGVVFSGGECTTHPTLSMLAREAKKMGYKIKVDTNGSRPDRLRKLMELELIDYIALDFKAPEEKHEAITKSKTWRVFNESLQLIRQYQVPFEVRTTWHSSLLSMDDLDSMVDFLVSQAYSGRYYIQRFMNGVATLDDTLPASMHRLDISSLSRPDIQVVLR